MGIRTIKTLPVIDELELMIANSELNQARAARELGVSRATISHWMRGVVVPSATPEMVAKLSEVLRRSKNDVLEMFGFELSEEVPEPASVGASRPYLGSVSGEGTVVPIATGRKRLAQVHQIAGVA